MFQPVDAWRSKRTRVCAFLRPNLPSRTFLLDCMPKTDEVPVYYHDQDASWEKPGRGIATRQEVRFLKVSGVGKFFDHGRKFRLNEERPTIPRDFYVPDNTPAAIEGRNSCRRVGEYPDVSYRVKHFSYPVPAVGARNRPMHPSEINKIPVELLAAASLSQQVQA